MMLSDLKNRFNVMCGRMAIMPFVSHRNEANYETFSNASALFYGRAIERVLNTRGEKDETCFNGKVYAQGGLQLNNVRDCDGRTFTSLYYQGEKKLDVIFPRFNCNTPAGPLVSLTLSPDKAWRHELMALYDETAAPRAVPLSARSAHP